MADPTIERLCRAVDAETMMTHLREFARRVKLSGTPEERESFRYLQSCLDGYGWRTELLEHDAYISLPGRARLEIDGASPDCITHSFSRPSPPGGLRGRLVYAGAGTAADFAAADVRGKIVLLEAIANPGASLRASEAGAIGQIHISPHRHLHEMCISPVWGSPTEVSRERLPRTVVLSVRQDEGAALRSRVRAGEAVDVTLHAEVDTGWRRTPLLVAELLPPGGGDDAPFVMFSGHHDTWYFGVMDNGGANATMLEIARLFAPERAGWRRGLRLCFWSGHSHGRYSGSTWYADTHWAELHRRCVAHVNVDSTGARGNTVLADALSSAELRALAAEAVREQGGQTLEGLRMSRAGDQSFWGIGIPSIFMAMGEQPAGGDDNVLGAVLGGRSRKSAGLGWWWHTPEDTLDKMDPELLVRDTRIYVHTICRLLSDRVLPLDYAAQAESLRSELASVSAGLRGRLDLGCLLASAEAVRAGAAGLVTRAESVRSDDEAERINAALVALARALVPMDYTRGDRFEHDPALSQSPYPVLDPLRALASAGPEEAPFLAVSAQRACNRLAFALETAKGAIQTTIQK